MTEQTCPNCSAEIKGSFFGANKLLENKEVEAINYYNSVKAPGYCNKCGDSLYSAAAAKAQTELNGAKFALEKMISYIPALSIQSPTKWDYTAIGIVTAQTVTGTGAITEFVTSFTDFIGGSSSRLAGKLKAGEQLCLNQLRYQALKRNGNAIVGVDIDYAEVGGDKGMLMVAMTGTIVFLNNTDVLNKEDSDSLIRLGELMKLIDALEKIV